LRLVVIFEIRRFIYSKEVVAQCFEDEISRLNTKECYFNRISEELKPKRDKLSKILLDAGITPVIPEGGYFMLADISKIAAKFNGDDKESKDSKFVKYLIKEKGLATIPSSVFFSQQNQNIGQNFIRFCFIKVGFYLKLKRMLSYSLLIHYFFI
jgi:kynurenine--oxoglutarate transaminase/cysteine-S-conjugate beta-lyase/glutamine--phenylpyruvate transaminase